MMGRKFSSSLGVVLVTSLLTLILFWSCEPGSAIDVIEPETNDPAIIAKKESAFIGFVNWPTAMEVGSVRNLEIVVMDSARTQGLSNLTALISLSETALGTVSDTSGKELGKLVTDKNGASIFRFSPEKEGTVEIEITVLDRKETLVTNKKSIAISAVGTVIQEITKQVNLDVLNPVINADGVSKSPLRVTVKDEFNHPLTGLEVKFSSTGGTISASAVTDEYGVAMGWVRSERHKATVYITATVNYLGKSQSETRSVAFDGLTIAVEPAFGKIGKNLRDTVVITLKDGAGVPITNDTIVVRLSPGFTLEAGDKDSVKVVSDGFGRYVTWVSADTLATIGITAQALGVTGYGEVEIIDNTLANVHAPRAAFPNWPTVIRKDSVQILGVGLMDSVTGAPLADLSVRIFPKGQLPETISDTAGKSTNSFITSVDGAILFRFTPVNPGRSELEIKIINTEEKTLFNASKAIEVIEDDIKEAFKKFITLRVVQPVIDADGISKTQLKATIRDDKNHPITGETVGFSATGGTVVKSAVTDSDGVATGWIKSERRNMTVYITASIVVGEQSLTETQGVVFSGIQLTVTPRQPVVKINDRDSILVTLKDAGSRAIPNETVIIQLSSGFTFEGGNESTYTTETDAFGMIPTWIASDKPGQATIKVFALGAENSAVCHFTNNTLAFITPSEPADIMGDGNATQRLEIELRDGNNLPLSGKEVKWNTTFGSFVQFAKPITATDDSGRSGIDFKSPEGTGVAVISVEARNSGGEVIATGAKTITVTGLLPHRLKLSMTPDNIPISIGEAVIRASAYDSNDHIINGLLIGFRIVESAGGGDEVLSVSTAYTDNGVASSVFKAGSVVSKYRGVKLTAVALEVKDKDTTVLASSDTVGLTVSGPPHFISIGVNLEKGENPNDGTFKLPFAAVVTDINGNLVADGTKVHFSLVPSGYYGYLENAAEYLGPVNDSGYAVEKYFVRDSDGSGYFLRERRLYQFLPWSDYNNNGALDTEVGEQGFLGRPYRGEDRNGNGKIDTPPERYYDLNGNLRRETGLCPDSGVPPASRTAIQWMACDFAEPFYRIDPNGNQIEFVDFDGDGVWDQEESYVDLNNNGYCDCYGATDNAGNPLYYEFNFEGGRTAVDAPLPFGQGGGVMDMVETMGGKASNFIMYPQSDARKYHVRLTAEANGITDETHVRLPVIVSDE